MKDYQKIAIETDKKQVIVNAAAASGKTFIITERVKWLVKNNVARDRIVVITFTNNAAGEMYYGCAITRRLENGAVVTGTPTPEMLAEWGFELHTPPTPQVDVREQRMQEILAELASMDYLTSKYIDGEDMTEYGDWQGKRKTLREEYRQLEEQINK